MANGSYYGGSTLIKTGNKKLQLKVQESSNLSKKLSKIKGYILHKNSGDVVLSPVHGARLVEIGSCREIGRWEGYISVEFVRGKKRL